MRKDDNIMLAKELLAVAKDLIAVSSYDTTRYFQKAISKPTPQNIGKFTKSIGISNSNSKNKTSNDENDELTCTKDLVEIAQEMLDSDDEEEEEKEENDEI